METPAFLDIVKRNFDSALGMLRKAVQQCPDELFGDTRYGAPIWQLVYHSLDSLEFYLGDSPNSPRNPPYGLKSTDLTNPPGPTPSRSDFLVYFEDIYTKCGHFMDKLTPEQLFSPNSFP